MRISHLFRNSFLLFFLFFSLALKAQRSPYASSEILHELQKMQVLGRVLYVAAHPDDENTRLIAYLANEKKLETAYLSLTRGDGGQNLIGAEIREGLGLIRTNELMQAREIDGGRQFFTRANDFGFSKNPDETFNIWDREEVLSDVVRVVRLFKPDIIITRFSLEPGITHGHHTASAILAKEAFEKAADPAYLPEQVKELGTWQANAIFWNTSTWFYRGSPEKLDSMYIKMEVGGFNPLLGYSYGELAGKSRSMHKSQGFGAAEVKGSIPEYFEQWGGKKVEKSIFEHVNLSWARISKGDKVQKQIDQIIKDFNPQFPANSVKSLLDLRKNIVALGDSHFKQQKLQDLNALIVHALGLSAEALTNTTTAAPGESIDVRLQLVNRSEQVLQLQNVLVAELNKNFKANLSLKPFQLAEWKEKITISEDFPLSSPYWLKEPSTLGMYSVSEPGLRGTPINKPAISMDINVAIGTEIIPLRLPLIFKKVDPVEGEVTEPFYVVPAVSVNPTRNILLFANGNGKELQIKVEAGKDNVKGELVLNLPNGWKASKNSLPFELARKGQSDILKVMIESPKYASLESLGLSLVMDAKESAAFAKTEISYKHIPKRLIFSEAQVKLVKVDVEKEGKLIAYIPGAGDDVPAAIEQMGYEVEVIFPGELSTINLSKYDAIVAGVRAYNTQPELRFMQDYLHKYVENGGTYIVQYNTSQGLVTLDLAPYDLKLSRDRVTVEEAPVRILARNHVALNFPNRISDKDFEGWVQERGLYFPNQWAPEFTALISSNDPGENPLDGGLLVARHGKGHYVYTGYSWFRQLPAGVPGAYRIFANLLSLSHTGKIND